MRLGREGKRMKPMKAITVLALTVAMAMVLVACGGNSNASTSSGASSSAASGDATGQAPSESYMRTKFDVTYNDGSTMGNSSTFDDRGRRLTGSWEMASPDLAYDCNSTITDWDEYGHTTKIVETYDYGGGELATMTGEVSHQVNEDGSIASNTWMYKPDKEDKFSSEKITITYDYGSDVQVFRKVETKTEFFDKTGALLTSKTLTSEFDEDGLETRYAYKYVEANGTETSKTADITWTKDADGKPVSYTIVSSQNGADTVTGTGDVKTDESGLISWVGNVKTDGKALPTTATIGYAKIDNPLPNAYEGWKSFMLSDVIL